MSPIILRIQELRERRGWSQAELARRAGVARATINRLELHPPLRLDILPLEGIARALQVDPAYLIIWDHAGDG